MKLILFCVLAELLNGAHSSSLYLTDRIIKGENAGLGQWPWQVHLLYEDKTGESTCGGSLIADKWVLTAAHCVEKDSKSLQRYTVVLGEHQLSVEHGPEQKVNVTSIIMHPNYVGGNVVKNDVCLLKLSEPANIAHSNISIIPLPSEGQNFTGKSCYISGWGITHEGEAADILQHLSVKVMTTDACNKWLDDYEYVSQVICVAGGVVEGSCEGDSGGPLMCEINGSHILAGVTSWGSDDCSDKEPSIYMEVSRYLRWINQIIAN